MPLGDVTIAQMEAADLAQAEPRFGPNGETVREMIRNTYRCASAAKRTGSFDASSRYERTTMIVFEDIETQSECDLPAHGAYRYATDPSTDVLFVCFACDNDPVQTWRPGDPVPAPFTEPLADEYVWDNWTFERYIHEFILTPRYRFAPIPLERTSCAERLALANAYPAKLGLRCEALDLPFRKNPEAHKALMRVSRLKKHKYKTAEARERDPIPTSHLLVLGTS